jgi:hypothetical protein
MIFLLSAFVLLESAIAFAEFVEDPPVYLRQWAVPSPSGVAFDSSRNIYVVDRSHKLVKKSDYFGVPITEWASCGSSNLSQCTVPYDIALDSNDNMYVIDTNGIVNFDNDGKFIKRFGLKGSFGSGIAVHSFVDSVGNPFCNVYVTNSQSHSVQKFSSDGTLLTQWGRFGTAIGQFRYPYDVAVDSEGNVYVADSYNWRIQKFDSNGNFLAQWPSVYATGLAIDALDNIYVISWANCSIQKFTHEGILLTQWGSCGNGEGKFKSPFRISISPAGEIYVSDTDNNRIQVFRQASSDEDNDGIPDDNDNCPENFNPRQEDNDQDGTGDECDRCPLDPDNDRRDKDGICGDVDNCPENFNPDQTDDDADGIGDVCDPCNNRPIIGTIYPSKAILWPPDHRMVPVTVEASSLMGHNPTVQFRIPDDIPEINPVTIIERNKEGDNIYSENNFEPDFEKTDALSLNLRSERAGISQGRTYIITVTAEDCSGSYNFTTEVIVPHDKGK